MCTQPLVSYHRQTGVLFRRIQPRVAVWSHGGEKPKMMPEAILGGGGLETGGVDKEPPGQQHTVAHDVEIHILFILQ